MHLAQRGIHLLAQPWYLHHRVKRLRSQTTTYRREGDELTYAKSGEIYPATSRYRIGTRGGQP